MISFVIISKHEPLIERTLSAVGRQAAELGQSSEIVVVDASEGRLKWVQERFPDCRWIDFVQPAGVQVSIPHQRNLGVRSSRGEIVAFTDCGCVPDKDWASVLIAPLLSGAESVTVGRTTAQGGLDLYDTASSDHPAYVDESPTINMAFTREAFDAVGGFDESFEYGSDVDFNWRLAEHGYRMRMLPDAVVRADWGSHRRQLRRAWSYGRARARLYAKHRKRLRFAWHTDPVPFAYALFVLLLPLTRRYPLLPALLLVPALRNRRTGMIITMADHVVLGAGFLRELSVIAARGSRTAGPRRPSG